MTPFPPDKIEELQPMLEAIQAEDQKIAEKIARGEIKDEDDDE